MPLPPASEAKVRKHSFHVKWDYQLADMLVSHQSKLDRLRAPGGDLEKYTQDPNGMGGVKYELKQQFPELSVAELAQEFFDQQAYYIWKDVTLDEIVKTIPIEQDARAKGIVNRSPIGTTYYVDGDAGNNGSAGTATGSAWLDIDQFTENARSAGDICIVRRGTTVDDGTDLLFTSDGTKVAPITIEADYANAFGDDVDLSVTATATLTFGSKIITFSADVSGVVAVGDVIYVAAEDADEFAYEVSAVSTVTVTLFLPYKGGQDGSGKTMTNMQANPVWNTAAGVFQWNFDGDYFWKIQGIHIRGSDGNGNVESDSCSHHEFKDVVFEANGGVTGIKVNDDGAHILALKCRFYNHFAGLGATAANGGFCRSVVVDTLFDGNSVANSFSLSGGRWDTVTFIECEHKRHGSSDIKAIEFPGGETILLRNNILASSTEVTVQAASSVGAGVIFSSDHDGGLGVTKQYLSMGSSSNTTPAIESDTGTVRSGGGAVSGKCTPSTNIGIAWELSRILLFEIPLYATTASKKYEIFFRPTATADWTADPTAAELWIEIEYWGHATNDYRRILKSTGVIDMNGSTTFTALDVTVAPAQAGVAYLRGYYAKTKESAKANTFFWDVVPVVT